MPVSAIRRKPKIVPLGNALARSGSDTAVGQPGLTPPLPLETRPALPVESPSDLPPPAVDNKDAALPFSALWALLIGIGIAFTPCVLPMYPLISGIVLGGQKRLSTARALLLAFIYVQGMALTYTALGLVVAAAGLQFQAALQHPYVLIGLSVLFILAGAVDVWSVYAPAAFVAANAPDADEQ